MSLLFGLVGGTILGVLFAPHKGKEVREKLIKEREKGGTGLNTLKEELSGMGKEMKNFSKDVYESDNVQAGIQMGKEKMQQIKEVAQEHIEGVSEKACEKAGDMRDIFDDAREKNMKGVKKKVNAFAKRAKKKLKDLQEKGKKFTRE